MLANATAGVNVLEEARLYRPEDIIVQYLKHFECYLVGAIEYRLVRSDRCCMLRKG
jgi:hypothetical protein